MTRISLAAAVAMGLLSGSAMAQTSETTTTTITTQPPTISTQDREVVTKTYPFSNLVTTEEKKTETTNGMATQSQSTVHAYPPGSTIPPVGTSTTRTIESK
jgi:hypothetical protein